jgi:hypothetical protein
LTEKISDRSGDLDAKILVDVQGMVMAIKIAQHLRCNVDGEDIVSGSPLSLFDSEEEQDRRHSRISEEADASNAADFHVEPPYTR